MKFQIILPSKKFLIKTYNLPNNFDYEIFEHFKYFIKFKKSNNFTIFFKNYVFNSQFPTHVIDGNIGAGKSTLLEKVNKSRYCVIPEPLEIWLNTFFIYNDIKYNFLEIFYKSSEFSNYHNSVVKILFQFYALLTRVFLITEIKSDLPKIIERHPLSDIIFYKLNSNDIFGKSCKKVDNFINKCFAIINEKCKSEKIYWRFLGIDDSEKCFNQMKKRNRLEEKNISFEYIQKLNESYVFFIDFFLNPKKNIKILYGDVCDYF